LVGNDGFEDAIMVDQRFDRVFAAFEAAWKSGKRPGAEAAFKHFPDDQQDDALAKLLTIEIAMRRAAGESLNPSDFQRRFPRNLDLIEAAFAADDPPSPVEPLKVTRDERNLLSAIVAMQNQFIDQAMFTEAIQHCATNKDAELTKILQTEGYITRAQESLLVALVAKHLEGHNENAKESIAALSSLGPVKHAIASIVNPQVRQDIETIIGFESKPIVLDEAQTIPPSNEMATIPPSDETQTLPPSRSGSTGDGYTHTSQSGSRFRIVRPHARGGLGQVSVAIDSELNRDVALKEIQPQYADDKDSRYRFRLEAEVTGRLEHPGIVPV